MIIRKFHTFLPPTQDGIVHIHMKVLFVITKSNWGGAQSYVYDLAVACKQNGIEPIIAAGPKEIDTSENGLIERAHTSNIRTVSIKNFSRDVFVTQEIRSLWELLTLIRKERPSVVHVNSSKAAGIGTFAARILRTPTIVFTVHGWAFREQRPWLIRALIWLSSWATALLSDIVITVSDADEKDGARMPLIRNKIRTIRNGIGDIAFADRAAARNAISDIFGDTIPDSRPWVWTNGELTKNKGIRYALQAVRQLRDAGFPVSYIITGSGEERESLENLVRELQIGDLVHFCGFVPNVPRYAKAFDVYLLPSMKEGLPYVLLEAGLAGLPIVATDVGGVTDIIRDGVSGIVIPPKNPARITDAVKMVIEHKDLALGLGENVHERVLKEFSLERMVRETIELYGR